MIPKGPKGPTRMHPKLPTWSTIRPSSALLSFSNRECLPSGHLQDVLRPSLTSSVVDVGCLCLADVYLGNSRIFLDSRRTREEYRDISRDRRQ